MYSLNTIRRTRIIEISDSLLDQKRFPDNTRRYSNTKHDILTVCKTISSHSRQTDVTNTYAEAAAFNATDLCSQKWKLNTQPNRYWNNVNFMVDRSCIAHISFVVVSNCHQIKHLIVISLLRLFKYAEKNLYYCSGYEHNTIGF